MDIQLVAHRGLQTQYPENSLLAVEAAISLGARHIEIDIQYSQDNHPVLYHDATLERVSGLSVRIDECPLSQLLETPCFEPDRFGSKFINNRISRLDDLVPLLQANPEVQLFVEIKRYSLKRLGHSFIIGDLQRRLESVKQQIILISFDLPCIQSISQHSDLAAGLVLETVEQLASEAVQRLNPTFLFLNHKKLVQQPLSLPPASTLVLYEIDNLELAWRLLQQGHCWFESFDFIKLKQGLNDVSV